MEKQWVLSQREQYVESFPNAWQTGEFVTTKLGMLGREREDVGSVWFSP